MTKLGLRTRFLLSGAALVLTTIACGVWSALAFSRLAHVVGDTLHDLAMGRTAGVGLKVGVLTGTGTQASLAAHADMVLGSIAELEGAVFD